MLWLLPSPVPALFHLLSSSRHRVTFVLLYHDPHQVQEQRLTGLIQALLCGACLAATPVIKQIPTAVMWGYFIFMAIGELPAAWGCMTLGFEGEAESEADSFHQRAFPNSALLMCPYFYFSGPPLPPPPPCMSPHPSPITLPADSLPGSQFGERLLLLATDPKKVVPLLEQQHAAYLGAVPLHTIVWFTLLQLALLAGVWALVTWAGVSGGG